MLKEPPSPGPARCAGCLSRIRDRFYLLAVDRPWHLGCLRCSECKLPLDSELTCFSRLGNIYCKDDYYRLFAVKRCARCQAGISASELVMRARDAVFHLHCFSCASCGALLAKGDHFGMRDGMVYCQPHYELLRHRDFCGSAELEPLSPGSGGGHWSSVAVHKGRPRKRKLLASSPPPDGLDASLAVRLPLGVSQSIEMLHSGDLSSSMESLVYDSASSPGVQGAGGQQRTKRMRTSFKHHQLRTMKSYFNVNQNPDAKDLKQLAQKTGLSKRVLQVWFQNARAKWRRNIMRQEGGPGALGAAPPGGPPQGALGDAGGAPEDLHGHLPHPLLLHHHHAAQQGLPFGELY